MSFFSLFWPKKPARAPARAQRASAPRPPAPAPKPGASRQLARDQLFSVIRDAMNASGVLSSAYKFKVLDLGTSGRRFAVLIHLGQEPAEGAKQFIFVESVIKRIALSRSQLQVDVVYWHVGEPYSRKPARHSPLQPLQAREPGADGPSSDFMAGTPLSNTQYGDLPPA